MPFQLPTNFPPRVSDGLEKKMLYGKAHAKFITTIAQAIYRYKSFPTEDEYYHVVQALVKAWPFLDKGQGLLGYVAALRMRMAYLRKPEDRKRGENPGKPLKFVAGKSKMPSVPVGEPAGKAGEDEASMLRHQKRCVYSC